MLSNDPEPEEHDFYVTEDFWASSLTRPAAFKEIKKIKPQIEKIKKDLEKVQNKLADEKFTSKAPAHILERERKIEAEYLDKLTKLEENLKAFSK